MSDFSAVWRIRDVPIPAGDHLVPDRCRLGATTRIADPRRVGGGGSPPGHFRTATAVKEGHIGPVDVSVAIDETGPFGNGSCVETHRTATAGLAAGEC